MPQLRGNDPILGLNKYCFVIGFHQQVKKEHEKSWHVRHIKHKKF
jgi:hypothetical protein